MKNKDYIIISSEAQNYYLTLFKERESWNKRNIEFIGLQNNMITKIISLWHHIF